MTDTTETRTCVTCAHFRPDPDFHNNKALVFGRCTSPVVPPSLDYVTGEIRPQFARNARDFGGACGEAGSLWTPKGPAAAAAPAIPADDQSYAILRDCVAKVATGDPDPRYRRLADFVLKQADALKGCFGLPHHSESTVGITPK